LQSQGVHEGTFRYEIGDPQMKIEQNFCAEADSRTKQNILIYSNGIRQPFLNYIICNLHPMNFSDLKFTATYNQRNASRWEATMDWSPKKAEWLDVSAAYSWCVKNG